VRRILYIGRTADSLEPRAVPGSQSLELKRLDPQQRGELGIVTLDLDYSLQAGLR
jgi:hypothetical protein